MGVGLPVNDYRLSFIDSKNVKTEAALCALHRKEYIQLPTFCAKIIIEDILLLNIQLFLHLIVTFLTGFKVVCVEGMRSLSQVNIWNLLRFLVRYR